MGLAGRTAPKSQKVNFPNKFQNEKVKQKMARVKNSDCLGILPFASFIDSSTPSVLLFSSPGLSYNYDKKICLLFVDSFAQPVYRCSKSFPTKSARDRYDTLLALGQRRSISESRSQKPPRPCRPISDRVTLINYFPAELVAG